MEKHPEIANLRLPSPPLKCQGESAFRFSDVGLSWLLDVCSERVKNAPAHLSHRLLR